MNKKTLTILIALLIIIIGYGGYQVYSLTELKNKLNNQIVILEKDLSDTQSKLSTVENDNADLIEALDTEQRRNSDFEDQIENLADTVGVLDKLSKIDPELLQKYSKVYFLNEHYVPERLSKIRNKYVVEGKSDLEVEARIEKHLENLLDDADDDNINLRVISAYRGFFEQQQLKNAYTVTYGSGANAFSADQGFSEHQLGTAVDFTTEELGFNFTNIENTAAYEWLTENAWKYGFALSYPKNNQYYIFEPWHWRFVGKDLARALHRDDAYFYDWDQRDIDEYLIDFFE